MLLVLSLIMLTAEAIVKRARATSVMRSLTLLSCLPFAAMVTLGTHGSGCGNSETALTAGRSASVLEVAGAAHDIDKGGGEALGHYVGLVTMRASPFTPYVRWRTTRRHVRRRNGCLHD